MRDNQGQTQNKKKRLIFKKGLINDTANKVWNVYCILTVINTTVLYTLKFQDRRSFKSYHHTHTKGEYVSG